MTPLTNAASTMIRRALLRHIGFGTFSKGSQSLTFHLGRNSLTEPLHAPHQLVTVDHLTIPDGGDLAAINPSAAKPPVRLKRTRETDFLLGGIMVCTMGPRISKKIELFQPFTSNTGDVDPSPTHLDRNVPPR
jgi:hypothetical protein